LVTFTWTAAHDDPIDGLLLRLQRHMRVIDALRGSAGSCETEATHRVGDRHQAFVIRRHEQRWGNTNEPANVRARLRQCPPTGRNALATNSSCDAPTLILTTEMDCCG